MKSTFVRVNSIFFYIFFAFLLRLIFRIKRQEIPVLRKENNYIIASNHVSKLDPFLILASLPFTTFLKLIPIWFVTTNEYLIKWYYRLPLLALGCISTKQRKNEKVLDLLKNLLANGDTIFIFPMGGIKKRAKRTKVGVVYLEREVKNSFIIPVNINISLNISLANIFFRSVSVNVRFKQPYRHKIFSDDLQPLADEVMRRIFI
jgi:1-acyl-sn-glycerol-3-phosphate acyltransferase